MVEEEDLWVVKAAAAREGRPEADYFREAFHIAALHARRWTGDWDIPAFDFGGPVTEDDVREAVDRMGGAAGDTGRS